MRVSKVTWHVGVWDGVISIQFYRDGWMFDLWTFKEWADILPTLMNP